MTNLHSVGGSMVWMLVAALLMLATFEPISVGQSADFAAKANTAAAGRV